MDEARRARKQKMTKNIVRVKTKQKEVEIIQELKEKFIRLLTGRRAMIGYVTVTFCILYWYLF